MRTTSDYRAIFLENKPLIDVRSPGEFLKGAFPMARNIPLLTDQERAAVGSCYKHHGQEAAINLGTNLVSGALREERLNAWMNFVRHHPDGCLYCFRRGLRSSITQQWLSSSQINYPLVTGGYKAMRRFLIEFLDDALANMEVVLVSGRTGVGKTRVLYNLEQGVDLEGLAKHRGSTFGGLLEPQPSQIDFENALSIEVLKVSNQSKNLLFLEDEGKLIGRLSLPDSLRKSMSNAAMVFVEASFDQRVETILQDYIVKLGQSYHKVYGLDGVNLHRDRLLEDLLRIRRRLGGERQKHLSKKMIAGFEEQRSDGGLTRHREWISELLRTYYDPMYDYQLSHRKGRRLMSGSHSEVLDWAKDYSHCSHLNK